MFASFHHILEDREEITGIFTIAHCRNYEKDDQHGHYPRHGIARGLGMHRLRHLGGLERNAVEEPASRIGNCRYAVSRDSVYLIYDALLLQVKNLKL